MKTEESISLLYKILEKHFGPSEARQTVSAVLSNVIGDLQDKGLPISEEAISKGLAQAAEDYKFASKVDVA